MINSEDEIRIINTNGQIITTKLTNEIKIIDDEGHVVTAKPTDSMHAHLDTSCNKDVAVAMLLGLLREPKHPRTMVMMPIGVSVDLLLVLQEPKESLLEMLSHWRDVAIVH